MRFYFRTADNESLVDDEVGQEFSDLLDAVDEAGRIMAEMAADDVPRKNADSLIVEVMRSDGIPIVRLALTLTISYPALEKWPSD